MKKFYLVLMVVAALSLATLSCSKEAMDPSQPEPAQKEETQKEESTPENPAEEEESPVPEGMIRLTFGVSQEGDAPAADGEDTKTSWDGTNHAWSDGDRIRIFWGTGAEDYVDATVENNKVEALVKEADNYYAVYPHTGAFAYRGEGAIDFGIPILQSGSFKDANMMAATTSKAAATFNFKNLTHIFKFHLTDDSPFDRFQFCTNNGSIVVNTYGVSFDLEGNVTIGKRTQEISGFANSKYVRLHEGMTPGGDYYFAVVPGAQYSLGFGLQARISGETGDYSVAALSKGEIDTSNPREITNLGNLDPYVHSDWFITADGTGNGTSWDNPGGPALLRSLLVMPSTFTTDQAKKNHTIRLNNAKIHLKEGTYNFQTILADTGQKAFLDGAFHTEVNNVTVIDGGYPSSATGKDLSGYDPEHYPSVIISNQAANNDRAFYFNGARLYDWTFKGLSFQNNPSGSNFNTPGGAMAINGATNANIKFEDCSFSLKTTNTSGGGAFSFRGSAEVNAEFKNCTFTSCESSSYGGAIWINTTNHNLTFDGCTVTNNTATNGGGLIYIQNAGTITFQNSTSFESNSSNAESGNGGVIYTHASAGGELEISNCSFSENSAFNGGAIYSACALHVNSCTFTECEAIQGGAIYSAGNTVLDGKNIFINNKATGTSLTDTYGGAVWFKGDASQSLFVDGATFKNNLAPRGAAIAATGGSSGVLKTVIIFNCTFESNTATGSSGTSQTQQGGIVFANGYGTAIIANSTAAGNTTTSPSSVFVTNGGNIPLYVVSCTAANNSDRDLTRTGTNMYVYNSILMGPSNTEHNNVKKNHSIINTTLYGETNTQKQTSIVFGLGKYSDGGVFLLDDSKEALYINGMTADALKELTFTNILTPEQKELLGKDQKGNLRGDSKIMGAYVLTTDPPTE